MTAPVIQVRDPLQENLQFAIQIFLQGRARRDAKAREAFALVPEGTTAGVAAKDKQLTQVLKRGFGIDPSKLDAETVLKPVTTAGVLGRTFGAGERAIGRVPGLQESVGTTAIATQAGRPARGITTPAGLQAEAAGGEAAALRDRAVQLGASQAVEKLRFEDPEAFQQFSLGQVVEALPSEVVARTWTATLKFHAAKLGVEVATNPDNPINKILKPLGISAGDAIGAVATGIDGLLTSLVNASAQAGASRDRIAEIWEQARANAALDTQKAFGGRVDPTFVAAIFQGDPAASATPIGQELIKFMAAGIVENMTKRVIAGDPSLAAMIQAIPFMREFKDDPEVAIELLGLAINKAYKAAGTDLGEALPMLEKNRGVLKWVWDLLVGSRLEVRRTPGGRPPPEEAPAGLGRTGGGLNLQPPGPEATEAEKQAFARSLGQGTGLQLSEADRQSLTAFITALQGIVQQPGATPPR